MSEFCVYACYLTSYMVNKDECKNCSSSTTYIFYSRLWSASSWGTGLVGSYDIQPGEQSGSILTFSRVPHGGAIIQLFKMATRAY